MPRRSIDLGKAAGTPGGAQVADALWPALTPQRAEALVKLSIECVNKEFPNKPSHIYEAQAQLLSPKEATPAFYGCFDWHSAVHGHWTMATLLRIFPEMAEAATLEQLLNQSLTPENIAREVAFIDQPRNATWERPYGYGWLLRLQAELSRPCTDEGPCARAQWARNLAPLASNIRDKLINYLERLSVPIRDGTHANTAFALLHALEYASATGDARLEEVVKASAMRFYSKDQDCPVHFEPSGEDFLSGCLGEALLMSKVMPAQQFGPWLEKLLPSLDSPRFATLSTPPTVLDLKDPRIGHLIGLSFHRAFAFKTLAATLNSPRYNPMHHLAAVHLQHGERLVADSGYGGAHWLASFNLLAYLAIPQPQPNS